MPKRCLLMVRDMPHYRAHAFKAGLERLGYEIITDRSKICRVVISWNRHAMHETILRRHELAGSTVVIAENGYVGIDKEGHHLFALSLNQHNGGGRIVDYNGASDRWDALGIDLKPWRVGGQDILMLPQRGIGSAQVAMPKAWPIHTRARLIATYPGTHVRIRHHPAGDKTVKPIEDDLNGVWATVTWASSAAIKAMIAGYPCFYDFKDWIGGMGGVFGATAGGPKTSDADRLRMLHRLAYAQWTAAEIESGEALERIIACNP